MEPLRVEALLLRSLPVGESDILLDMFTRELGRAACLVKGGKRSRRRFGGLLLSAHVLQADLAPTKSGDLWRLETASLRQGLVGLRLDWRRWIMAGPVLELMLRAFPTHAPQPGCLDLALLTLSRLERAEETVEMGSALLILMTRLLSLLGYGLALEACPLCGRAVGHDCRLSLAGGLVCRQCRCEPQALTAPPGLVKGLVAAQTLPPPALGRLCFPPALLGHGLDFLAAFWRQVLGHDLPSLDLVGQVPAAQKDLAEGRRNE